MEGVVYKTTFFIFVLILAIFPHAISVPLKYNENECKTFNLVDRSGAIDVYAFDFIVNTLITSINNDNYDNIGRKLGKKLGAFWNVVVGEFFKLSTTTELESYLLLKYKNCSDTSEERKRVSITLYKTERPCRLRDQRLFTRK